ncbi:uncharacterized protein C3orf85-like [Callorhinchus milii]|nr:uncharacterized protein C3orf85-like [Callorhinchus milii]
MSSAAVRALLLFAALIVYGVAAAPFLAEEEAHNFIRNKRQAGYWDPNHPNNVWGITAAEQASEYWTSLRNTAQYNIDLGSFAFAGDPSAAEDHIRAYMDYLRQMSTYLQPHHPRK